MEEGERIRCCHYHHSWRRESFLCCCEVDFCLCDWDVCVDGYSHGQLGIMSMSPRDMSGKNVVPTGKTKTTTTSFATKHDVVLMSWTGSYHHGSSSSSFEDDDVFIKELELFVTDSLWCYLRLHGLVEEEQQQKQEDGGGDYLFGQ